MNLYPKTLAEHVKLLDGVDLKLVRGQYKGDLNDCKTPGFYYTSFSYATNGPYTAGAAIIEVKPGATVNRIQVAYKYITGDGITEIALRYLSDTSWSKWRKITTTAV